MNARADKAGIAEEWLKRQHDETRAAEQLMEIFESHPHVIEEFYRFYLERQREKVAKLLPKRATPENEPTHKKPTAFDRVAAIFVSGDNHWRDTGEIAKDSGVARNVVANLLWSVHKTHFEQKPHATHKRMKMWKLTTEAMKDLSQPGRLTLPSSQSVNDLPPDNLAARPRNRLEAGG